MGERKKLTENPPHFLEALGGRFGLTGCVTAGAASVLEGADASFVVALAGRVAGVTYGTTVTLAATGGATAGTDFASPLTLDAASIAAGITFVGGVLTIPAASTVSSVTLKSAITADAVSPEAGEGLSVTLSAPTGASAVIGTATAATAITDVPVTYTLAPAAGSGFETAATVYTVTSNVNVLVDTLNVTTSGNVATITPSMTSIEVINLRATTGAVALDLSSSTGVTSVNVNNSSKVATVTKIDDAAFGVSNQTQDANINGSTAAALALNFDTVGTAATDITVDLGSANTLTGSGNSDTLILGGSKVDVITGGLGGDTLTGNGGNDKFVYAAGDSAIGTGTFDIITDFVANLLSQLPRWEGCPFVVPNPKTQLPYVSFFMAWDSARNKAGMPKLRIHDLRHSAASFLINSNHSLYVVQKLLGHTQIKTTARYSHLAPETMLNAADAMANAAGLGMPVVPDPVAPDPVLPGLRLVKNRGEEKVAA